MKVFRDSVLGLIELYDLSVRIVNTPEMYRLKRIKQLSVCEHVFPSASHNRFEHSLGVAWVATRVLRSFQQKQPDLDITDEDIIMIQVAGLVHDCGHGPLSHTFERANTGFCHEKNGLEIWNGLVDRLNIDSDIAEFVRGCLSKGLRRHQTKKWKWMYQLINNIDGGIDCDRLDYCLRDAQIASVKIGFDLERIIRGWSIDESGEFVFNSKLVGDVFAVHRARFLLFDTIYNHPTVKSIECMMVDILRLLLPDIDPKRDGDDIIYHFSNSDEPRHMKANALLRRIEERKLYRLTDGGGVRDVEVPIVAHYGSGADNPLKRTKFTGPVDHLECLCPSSFEKKYSLYFDKNA